MTSKSKRYCSVPECSSYVSKDVSLHYFPRNDPKLCKVWKHVLRIGKPLSKFLNVCSNHFRKEDFTKIITEEQIIYRRLKKGAIPSQKLPTGSHKYRITSVTGGNQQGITQGFKISEARKTTFQSKSTQVSEILIVIFILIYFAHKYCR